MKPTLIANLNNYGLVPLIMSEKRKYRHEYQTVMMESSPQESLITIVGKTVVDFTEVFGKE